MKKLYESYDPMLVGHLHHVLTDHGFDCLLKNFYLIGGAGDLPPNECWPELWVMDDRDYLPAMRLLRTLTGESGAPGEAWRCAGCGEQIEAQFSHCWNCGGERPAS